MSVDRDLKSMLKVIVEAPKLHAGWLNTLSYLEYVGFSKIVKSQDAKQMRAVTMQHAGEEIRHAQLLKKLALRAGGDEFDSYAPEVMLCGTEARDYFESVDHACAAVLAEESERARLCYLYVTWLVEVRALDVYGNYMQVVKEFGLSSPLESLLKEEDKHLSDVTEALQNSDSKFSQRKDEFQAIESWAYARFLKALNERLVSYAR